MYVASGAPPDLSQAISSSCVVCVVICIICIVSVSLLRVYSLCSDLVSVVPGCSGVTSVSQSVSHAHMLAHTRVSFMLRS